MKFYRQSWLQIDLDRLKQNIKTVTESTGKPLIAVIKANAYGAGDLQIASAALEAEAVMLAVSSLDEALSLRLHKISADILILGAVDPEDVPVLIRNDLIATVPSLNWVKQASVHSMEGLRVHLKVDTGMNRIGSDDVEELKQTLDLLVENKACAEGIFTHFYSSDQPDNKACDLQAERFRKAVEALDHDFRWIHCCNSDAAMHYHDTTGNVVRCGAAIYGFCSYDTPLKQCVSLYSRLVHVKQVEKGETVSYGATYTAQEKEWIGTLPIGYADGWIRRNQGRPVWVDGQRCPIVGRVCMDQMMIRLPHYYPEGTQVELIGDHIPLQEVAQQLDTIPYEVLAILSDRLGKVYIENGEILSVSNPRLEHY